MREDGTKIATEIKHFSHEHDLKLIDEVLNNQKCDGCIRARIHKKIKEIEEFKKNVFFIFFKLIFPVYFFV